MPGVSVTMYVKNEDLVLYSQNVELLNHKARVAFDAELDRIRKAWVDKSLEELGDDDLHDSLDVIRSERINDRLYKVGVRKSKNSRLTEVREK